MSSGRWKVPRAVRVCQLLLGDGSTVLAEGKYQAHRLVDGSGAVAGQGRGYFVAGNSRSAVRAGFARSVAGLLADRGHQMVPVPELGFVSMNMFNEDVSLTAVAEAQQGGGGSARVVRVD